MEAYLRLGLLLVAAIIVSLILFEAWYRRRQNKLANSSSFIDNAVNKIHAASSSLDTFSDPLIESSSESTAKSITHKEFEPLLDDAELDKILESFDKDSNIFTNQTLKKEPDKNTKENEFLTISIHAKTGEQFCSYELLQSIAATGMQFGEMNIFHYYSDNTNGTIPLFSLASATEPGEFDLDNMGDFSCIGLTLFMNLKTVPDAEEAFELMLQTAEQLAEDLNGELKADKLRPWSSEILKEYLSRIDHFQTLKFA